MIHMAFCSSIAYVLVSVLQVVEPVAMSRQVYVTSVVPIGALYAMSLWLSNSAYIYLSVSFIQVRSMFRLGWLARCILRLKCRG